MALNASEWLERARPSLDFHGFVKSNVDYTVEFLGRQSKLPAEWIPMISPEINQPDGSEVKVRVERCGCDKFDDR